MNRILIVFICYFVMLISACQKNNNLVFKETSGYCLYFNNFNGYLYLKNFAHNGLYNQAGERDTTIYGIANWSTHYPEKHWDIISDNNLPSLRRNNFLQHSLKYLNDTLRYFRRFPDLNILGKSEFVNVNIIPDSTVSNIVLGGINTQQAIISGDSILNVALDNSNFVTLEITGCKKLRSLYLKHDSMFKSGEIEISNSGLKNVFLRQKIRALIFSNCDFNRNTEIYGNNAPDTIIFDRIRFESDSDRIDLRRLGYEEDFSNKKIVIVLKEVSSSRILLDYNNYTFLPTYSADENENSWYSENYNQYKEIIGSQTFLKNEKGRVKASIELSVFEDVQKKGGSILVAIKTWWNNYGYEKEKVIFSSFEVFLFFSLLNFFIFRQLRETYIIDSIENAYIISNSSKRRYLKRVLSKILLCLTYSGFIFWGLKLNIEKLNLSNFKTSIWIIFQFIIGLISIGYIANLIVSK